MNQYTGYLIGGPIHGSIITLPSDLYDYRVIKQDSLDAFSDNWELVMGVYSSDAPLRFDPITGKPTTGNRSHTIYSWRGWDK